MDDRKINLSGQTKFLIIVAVVVWGLVIFRILTGI